MARRYEAKEFKATTPGVLPETAAAYREGLQQGANFASQPGTDPYRVVIEWDALQTTCGVYLQWGSYDNDSNIVWN